MAPHRFTNLPDEQYINLWIVEDDPTFRRTIVELVNQTDGMRCERDVSSCEELLKLLQKEFAPEVILMDIRLPGMNGIEGIKHIKSVSPATDVIVLTVFEDHDKIFKAICSGASGYLLKSSSADEIIQSIREVTDGGAPMNAQIARKVLDMFTKLAAPKGDYGLSDREKEILGAVIDGLTMREIAEKLFLSYFTIDTHMKNIYTKLQVHTRSGAVAKVLKEHLL